MHAYSRRNFLKTSFGWAGAAVCSGLPLIKTQAAVPEKGVPLSAHLWVYASKYPPNWDSTPELDTVFSDLKYAGYEGVELMEVNLRHDNSVALLNALIKKHRLPVTGTSYGAAMWNREKHDEILQDVVLVTNRLQEIGGTTFGISVGDAGRKKTEAELHTQAELLKEIINICNSKRIVANLHNHTYELRDGMHDFKETITRVPELKLGPDLNWLVRGGVDPVWFIKEYGNRMVYMHLRDQKADGKWTEAVGEGVMDFPAIAKALQQINYKGRAAVELAYDAPPGRSTRENWKISREYVRKVFGW